MTTENPLRRVDLLAPPYMGEDRITLELRPGPTPTVGSVVGVNVDYSATLPEFVVLPLEIIIRGPNDSHDTNLQRRYWSRAVRRYIEFVPREAGVHLVVLRETAHNHWWGRLRVEVVGPRRNDQKPASYNSP